MKTQVTQTEISHRNSHTPVWWLSEIPVLIAALTFSFAGLAVRERALRAPSSSSSRSNQRAGGGRRDGGGEGREKGIKRKKKKEVAANEGLGETRAVSGNSAWLTAEYRVKCLWLAGPGSRERGPAVAQVLWLHDYKAGAGRRPRPLALPPLERRLRPSPLPPTPPPPSLCGWTW